MVQALKKKAKSQLLKAATCESDQFAYLPAVHVNTEGFTCSVRTGCDSNTLLSCRKEEEAGRIQVSLVCRETRDSRWSPNQLKKKTEHETRSSITPNMAAKSWRKRQLHWLIFICFNHTGSTSHAHLKVKNNFLVVN